MMMMKTRMNILMMRNGKAPILMNMMNIIHGGGIFWVHFPTSIEFLGIDSSKVGYIKAGILKRGRVKGLWLTYRWDHHFLRIKFTRAIVCYSQGR